MDFFKQATGTAQFWNAPGATTPAAATSPRTSGGAAGANPTGAIAQAAASIINNTVDNLFMNKVYKSQADLNNAKAEAERTKARLSVLSNDQQSVLAAQLQSMNDDNAKTKLLNDMVVAITKAQLDASQYNVNEIYIAGLQSTGSANNTNSTNLSTVTQNAANNQIKLAVIVLVAAVIVVAAAIIFKKNNN